MGVLSLDFGQFWLVSWVWTWNWAIFGLLRRFWDWIWAIFASFAGSGPRFGPFLACFGVLDLDFGHFWATLGLLGRFWALIWALFGLFQGVWTWN